MWHLVLRLSWKLVSKANGGTPSWTYWIWNSRGWGPACVLIAFLVILVSVEVWELLLSLLEPLLEIRWLECDRNPTLVFVETWTQLVAHWKGNLAALVGSANSETSHIVTVEFHRTKCKTGRMLTSLQVSFHFIESTNWSNFKVFFSASEWCFLDLLKRQ